MTFRPAPDPTIYWNPDPNPTSLQKPDPTKTPGSATLILEKIVLQYYSNPLKRNALHPTPDFNIGDLSEIYGAPKDG